MSAEVKFMDLYEQNKEIEAKYFEELQKLFKNSSFVSGKKVEEFEELFAYEHGAKFCVAMNTGTAANHASLACLGVGPGDEVIVPANTFIATAWGAHLCGAKVVYVDCDEFHGIDGSSVEAAITEKTKAVVGVHLYGMPVDVDRIKEICHRNNIYFVEDCAQAHFAMFDGTYVGNFGETAAFSFYPGKNLGALGEGGCVLTNDPDHYDYMKKMVNQGQREKYVHDTMGTNYRMTEATALGLLLKLRYMSEWTLARKKVANMYLKSYESVPYGKISFPSIRPYADPVWHLFPVLVEQREKFMNNLKWAKIGCGMHYPIPCHRQPVYKGAYDCITLPRVEEYAEKIVTLPMHPGMNNENVYDIMRQVNKHAWTTHGGE